MVRAVFTNEKRANRGIRLKRHASAHCHAEIACQIHFMKHHTLFLAIAALAATSCSLQLDSQYGLRWDRRVLAPKDQTAHAESHSNVAPSVQAEVIPQRQIQTSEGLTLAGPQGENYSLQYTTPADFGATSPSEHEELLIESAPVPAAHENADRDVVPTENTPSAEPGTTSGQIVGLIFLMFLLFVTALISTLFTFIAFAWWIPEGDLGIFSGILPLLITIASIVGFVKLGKKVEALKKKLRAEKANKNS